MHPNPPPIDFRAELNDEKFAAATGTWDRVGWIHIGQDRHNGGALSGLHNTE
jgi:hypothetical protein